MLRPMVITQAVCYEIPARREDVFDKEVLEFRKPVCLFRGFEIRNRQSLCKGASSEFLWWRSLFFVFLLLIVFEIQNIC